MVLSAAGAMESLPPFSRSSSQIASYSSTKKRLNTVGSMRSARWTKSQPVSSPIRDRSSAVHSPFDRSSRRQGKMVRARRFRASPCMRAMSAGVTRAEADRISLMRAPRSKLP